MKYSHSLKQYGLNLSELAELQEYLEQRNFEFSEQHELGMLGTSTIVDSKVKGPAATGRCGIIIDYPWGFGNKGLQVVGDSRLEKAVEEYLKK